MQIDTADAAGFISIVDIRYYVKYNCKGMFLYTKNNQHYIVFIISHEKWQGKSKFWSYVHLVYWSVILCNFVNRPDVNLLTPIHTEKKKKKQLAHKMFNTKSYRLSINADSGKFVAFNRCVLTHLYMHIINQQHNTNNFWQHTTFFARIHGN